MSFLFVDLRAVFGNGKNACVLEIVFDIPDSCTYIRKIDLWSYRSGFPI